MKALIEITIIFLFKNEVICLIVYHSPAFIQNRNNNLTLYRHTHLRKLRKNSSFSPNHRKSLVVFMLNISVSGTCMEIGEVVIFLKKSAASSLYLPPPKPIRSPRPPSPPAAPCCNCLIMFCRPPIPPIELIRLQIIIVL